MLSFANWARFALPLTLLLVVAAVACSNEPVEVVKTVEVIKEVEVPVEVEKIVEKEVEVPKEVEVEKIIEVEKIVEVMMEPEPSDDDDSTAGPPIYQMGLFSEPITRNYWNFYGGPGGSVWTGYVLAGNTASLYGYSDQRFDWVPVVASDFPTELTKETVNGTELWTAEVPLKEGIQWSDGEPMTADDFVFTVNTVLDMQLGADWGSAVDRAFVEGVEKIDDHRVKVLFKAMDDEGNPQTPGLSVWQFGLGFMPIMPEHYWSPVIEDVKALDNVQQSIEALFAYVPDGEPTAGGFVFSKWEPGAFFENDADVNYSWKGAVVTEYANGAYSETIPNIGYEASFYGEPGGDKTLEYEVGPHVDTALFSIYGNQDAAILALTNGDIDYLFNPLGVEKGFQDRIRAADDLSIVTNADNGMFYMGFNTRKEPMSYKGFRQAIATIIDKEFVSQTVLQDSTIPMYSVVPEGNTFWHNADVPQLGKGMTRTERLEKAVALLKEAGFTYEQEPQMSEDGNFVEVQAQGLRMPDGSEMQPIEIIAPSPGYDPLRATFAIWIERWLNDLGIPARANLVGFNVLVAELFSDTVQEDLDIWILGWSLSLFPDYVESFFHSRHAPENEEGGHNWGGYANPEFDDLSFSLLSETSVDEARDKMFRIQEMLADDLPYIPLFTIPKLDTYRPSRVEYPYTTVFGGLTGLGGLQTAALIK
ncbi:MAG: ABC transporter substrate-binding protein [Chloroflexota bacterium]|nr:ABC transporter substrate-binding protein [Chloroflexota bacterium]